MKRLSVPRPLTDEEQNTVLENARTENILPETASLLLRRGYDTPEKIRRFLHPGKKNFRSPYELTDMDRAVARIKEAKARDEFVLVYGDYDADGISAAAILTRTLAEYGLRVTATVPNREDGYGLNVDLIEQASSDDVVDLVITVDCGISNKAEVEEILSLGMDVIVTDHHEISGEIPDTICINPKRDSGKTFDGLCGAGVAFQLSRALIGDAADKYLDFLAIATVADSMELVDVNRDFVFEGLKLLSPSKIRPNFQYLVDAGKEVTSSTISFTLGPRVNSAGRVGDARVALKLFLTDDPAEIETLSTMLLSYNLKRQDEGEKLLEKVKEKIAETGADKNVLMVYDENWKTGTAGIVAARLVTEYQRPAIVFAGQNGILKGSARTLDGVNVFEMIASAKDLLVDFGGHAQAAGVSVKRENFEALYSRLDAYMLQNVPRTEMYPTVEVAGELKTPFSMAFAEEIERMEPFGIGNRRPLFCTRVGAVNAAPLKTGSPHVAFSSNVLEMLKFSGVKQIPLLEAPVEKVIVFETSVSTYKQQQTLKGLVKDVLIPFDEPFESYSEKKKLWLFERSLAGKPFDANAKEITEEKASELATKTLYSTAFVSGSGDVSEYPFLKDLPVETVFSIGANTQNAVWLSPEDDALKPYENVVYLDAPARLFGGNGKNVYVIKDAKPNASLLSLDLSREAMGDAFRALTACVGKSVKSFTDLYYRERREVDGYSFVFSAAVFTELGFFAVEDGVLTRKGERHDLAESSLYTRVKNLKETQ